MRALRFYEAKGLLSPRREGLARLYSAADRVRLQLILKGKRLGFTLAEISEMVEAHERNDAGPDQQLKLSREKCLEQISISSSRSARSRKPSWSSSAPTRH